MKFKKIAVSVLAAAALGALGFGLSACGNRSGNTGRPGGSGGGGGGDVTNTEVKGVKDIKLGDSQARVKELLGEPYPGDEGLSDTVWNYYDDSYVAIADQMSAKNEELLQAIVDGDADKTTKLTNELLALEQKLETLTYKYVEIGFKRTTVDGKPAYTVSSVLYDSVRNASIPVSKTSKTVEAENVDAFTDMNTAQVAVKIEYTDGSYKNKYINGSLFGDLNTFAAGSATETWIDEWGSYSVTVSVNTSIAEGVTVENSFGDNARFTITALGAGTLTNLPAFSATLSGDGTIGNDTGSYAAWGEIRDSIKDLTVEDGVTGLADGCFYGMDDLEQIVLPDSVATAGKNVLVDCDKLTKASMPAVVSAAVDKTNMKDVTLTGDGEVPENAFKDCTALESITFGADIAGINAYAFKGCTALTEVTIPEKVKKVGRYAFSGCTALETVNFNAKSCVNTVEDESTSILSPSVKTVNIGKDVTVIPAHMFAYTSIRNVTIPDSVRVIKESAFASCKSLVRMTLGSGVYSIADSSFNHSFDRCYRLVEVYNKSSMELEPGSVFNGNVAYYAKAVTKTDESKLTTDNDGYVIYDGNTLVDYVGTKTEIVIPEKITSMNTYALGGHSELTSVILPDGLQHFDSSVFDGCGLKNFTEYQGLRYIGSTNNKYKVLWGIWDFNSEVLDCIHEDTVFIKNRLFYDHDELLEVVIPDNVKEIGEEAFAQSESIMKVTFGSSLETIGDSAFYAAPIAEIYNRSSLPLSLDDTDALWDDYGNINYDVRNIYTEEGGSKITKTDDFMIYDSNVILKYVGDGKNAVVPTGMVEIGESAFQDNNNITSLTIPVTVEKFGSDMIEYCYNLETITYSGTVAQWNAIEKGNYWSYRAGMDTENGYTVVHCNGGDINLN